LRLALTFIIETSFGTYTLQQHPATDVEESGPDIWSTQASYQQPGKP
jgi:hypothetical protein